MIAATGKPVAAIDCGTNTIKLLIAEPGTDGLRDVVRDSRMVRLGQGVDRTGELAPEALERAFAAIDEFADAIAEHRVTEVRFCATSATRDASNAADFTAGVRERLGVSPEVLSGEEEARLAFAGAVSTVGPGPAEPVLVVDIGGGSTELILGTLATGPTAAHSMDIGSVRLHERHVDSDPPSTDEVARLLADIDAALDGCPVDPGAARTVIGVAGTITTMAAAVLDLPAYDRAAIHGRHLDVARISDQVQRIVAMTVEERRLLPWMHPGRADVIDAGALIWDQVLRRTQVEQVLVSETDILDGIAWSLVSDER